MKYLGFQKNSGKPTSIRFENLFCIKSSHIFETVFDKMLISLCISAKCITLTQKCITVTQKCIKVPQKCITVTQECITINRKCITVTQTCITVTQTVLQ